MDDPAQTESTDKEDLVDALPEGAEALPIEDNVASEDGIKKWRKRESKEEPFLTLSDELKAEWENVKYEPLHTTLGCTLVEIFLI